MLFRSDALDPNLLGKQGGGATRAAKLLKIARVVKVLKLFKVTSHGHWADELDELLFTSTLNDYLKLAKLFCGTFFIGHLMACFWAAASRRAPWTSSSRASRVANVIVQRVRGALEILKVRSNFSERDREAYHVVLAAAAPPPVADDSRRAASSSTSPPISAPSNQTSIEWAKPIL